jgi:methyl-accepting chemotaxis protein
MSYVKGAGQTMDEIVNSVHRVREILGEMSSSSAEQSAGIRQVTSALSMLEQATQQNVTLVEQSAAAAESLKHQAERLENSVQIYRM